MQLFENYILIRKIERENTTASGLYLPESASSRQLPMADVLSCGPGRTTEAGSVMKMPVSPGDRVLYRKNSGQELEDGSILIRDSDLIALLD